MPRLLLAAICAFLLAASILPSLLSVVFLSSQLSSSPQQRHLFRRADACVDDIYCTPTAATQWIANPTMSYSVTWNPRNSILASAAAGNLIIELVDAANPSSHLQQQVVPNAQAYTVFRISDLDFGGANLNEAYRIKEARIRIYRQGGSPGEVPIGPAFSLVQPGVNGALPPPPPPSPTANAGTSNPSTATITATATSVVRESPSNAPSTVGVIVGVVVGGVAALSLAVLLFAVLLRRRRRIKAANAPGYDITDATRPGYMGAAAIAASVTALANRDGERGMGASLDSTAPLAPVPLPFAASRVGSDTSLPLNEAMHIANTYRQIMRKPSWSGSRNQGDADAEANSGDGSEAVELSSIAPATASSRSAVATQLIQRELAEEGRGLSSVKRGSGARAMVVKNSAVHAIGDTSIGDVSFVAGEGVGADPTIEIVPASPPT